MGEESLSELCVRRPLPAAKMSATAEHTYFRAAIAGDAATVEDAIGAGVEVNATDPSRANRTALHQAAEFGHMEVLRLLLKQPGIAVDAKDTSARSTPLQRAADMGHEDATMALLKARAETNYKHKLGLTALHHAANGGHVGTATV